MSLLLLSTSYHLQNLSSSFAVHNINVLTYHQQVFLVRDWILIPWWNARGQTVDKYARTLEPSLPCIESCNGAIILEYKTNLTEGDLSVANVSTFIPREERNSGVNWNKNYMVKKWDIPRTVFAPLTSMAGLDLT